MGPWPMDRLVRAAEALASDHDVFVQTGSSAVHPLCPHAEFVGFDAVRDHIEAADVVITHAGNTVRLVQRAGKVPIVVAREPERGELRNTHQMAYVGDLAVLGPAVVLDGDLHDLPHAVSRHPHVEAEMLSVAPLDELDPARAGEILDHVVGTIGAWGHVGREADNPFRDHVIRRYAWAWSQLAGGTGRHLELGIGGGASFLGPLVVSTGLDVVAADPHPQYVAEARRSLPRVPIVRTEVGGRLPFDASSFASASMLDVLEHVGDEDVTLAEVHRVLEPGAIMVMTVPARHSLSFLDADNAKLRFPRLHRAVYSVRYGSDEHRRRFVSQDDGLRGDLAWERSEHTNYRAGELIERLADHGFETIWRDGSNLLGRVIHVGQLLGPAPIPRLLDPLMRADGLTFHRANLFLTLRRT